MSFLVAIFVASCAFSGVFGEVSNDAAVIGSDVSIYGFLKCGIQGEPLNCAKSKVGRVLDGWEDQLQGQMKQWGEAADQEVLNSGRQLAEDQDQPSTAAYKLQMALNELTAILQKSLYRSIARKKESGGGIDSITISANQGMMSDKKKKMKKKKKKPANVHIHQQQPEMMMEMEMEKGPEQNKTNGEKLQKNADSLQQFGTLNQQTGLLGGMSVDQELVGPGKTRVKREGEQEDKEVGDGRGKKKKKKKAILKLLLLGAVLKAKIGLLLQLLSAHLQVKFFAIALAGLAINIARFWIDLKKGHSPQKVIYYEHAQHQHHYEHDDAGHGDSGWGGYWSRSLDTAADKKKEHEIIHEGETYPIESSQPGDEQAYGGWGERSGATRK